MCQLVEFLSSKAEFVASQTEHLTAGNQRSQLQIWQGSAFNNQHSSAERTSQQAVDQMTDRPILLHFVVVTECENKLLLDLSIEQVDHEIKDLFPFCIRNIASLSLRREQRGEMLFKCGKALLKAGQQTFEEESRGVSTLPKIPATGNSNLRDCIHKQRRFTVSRGSTE